MTVETPARRVYSEEDIAGALTSMRANEGQVRATSREIGVPATTLSQWARDARRPETAENSARRHVVSTQQAEETIQQLSAIIPQALARVAEALPTLNGYQAMLAAAIAIDKRQLLSGGPTSRTEVLRARYVEPTALRALAAKVVDVPVIGTTPRPRRSRKAKTVAS